MLELLVQVEIVKHGGVHVHELHRARRHVDRERRSHAKRRRQQRQRRRGEASWPTWNLLDVGGRKAAAGSARNDIGN